MMDRTQELATDIGITDEVSWTGPDNMTFQEWEQIGYTLQQIQKSLGFWIGDWLNYGERKWGEMYANAMDSTGVALETLKKYKAVAARIPPEKRRLDLSWSHHFALCYLPEEELDTALELAAFAQISSRQTSHMARLPERTRASLYVQYLHQPETVATNYEKALMGAINGSALQASDAARTSTDNPFVETKPAPPLSVGERVLRHFNAAGYPVRSLTADQTIWQHIQVRAVLDENGNPALDWSLNQ